MLTKKELNSISLDEKEVNKPKVKETFCEYWPVTREGILLFQKVVKNAIVKWFAGAVVIVGDNIHKSFCSK